MKRLITNLMQSCFAKPAAKVSKELSKAETDMLTQYVDSCTTVQDLFRFREVFTLFTPQMSGFQFQFYCAKFAVRLRIIIACNELKPEPYMTWELSKMFKKAASVIEVYAILTHIKRHRQAYIETNRPDLDIYTRMANKRIAELQSPLQNQSAI